jgi:hypothetical protein
MKSKLGTEIIYDIPTIPGPGVWMTVYGADHINISKHLWDPATGDRYVFVGIREWDYGGGHTVDKGIYKCDKLKDWKE